MASGQHVVLILDKQAQVFPWESMRCFADVSVSRVPSWQYLHDRLSLNTTIDPSKTHYLLNAGKDLTSTQEKFEAYLKKRACWQGTIGQEPAPGEIEHALATQDLFLYFGHGGAEHYMRPSKLRELDCRSVVILMGCSSGRLKTVGEFEPFGTALEYLNAGCPTLVANLWDVTDKDIDLFTDSMFDLWGLSSKTTKPVSLTQAVQQSRKTCKLKYLNGAAPVVYGLPIHLQ
jgi:separase